MSPAALGHYGIRCRHHTRNPAVIHSDDTLPDRSVPQSADQSSHKVVYGLALAQVRNSMPAITTARDEDSLLCYIRKTPALAASFDLR